MSTTIVPYHIEYSGLTEISGFKKFNNVISELPENIEYTGLPNIDFINYDITIPITNVPELPRELFCSSLKKSKNISPISEPKIPEFPDIFSIWDTIGGNEAIKADIELLKLKK